MNISFNNQLGFLGLKTNLRIGQNVLQEFSRDFPKRPRSFTRIDAKILEHSDDPKYKDIIEKLCKLSSKYRSEHQEIMMERIYHPYGPKDKFTRIFDETKEFGYANCDEQAMMIYDKLRKRDITAYNIDMSFINRDDVVKKNHIFTVFGVKEGSKVSDIKTWGNEAVVVDAWSNVAMGIKEAEAYFKKMLSYKPEEEKIVYKLYTNG